MTLLLISFIAGLLTVLAPCVLPLLPVIIGGSITGEPNPKRATVTVLSLLASVFAFTFILKVSTAFISVPPQFWAIVSGVLLITFGLVTLFPNLWDKLPFIQKMNLASNRAMNEGFKKKNFYGDILIGAALGPVFASCSPTYFLILASVLPASLAKGILYLLVYLVGMGIALFGIALLGQRLVGRLEGASDPNGWFKKGLGIIFLILGVLIIFGFDKQIQAYVVAHSGAFDVTRIEQYLLTRGDETLSADGMIPENLTSEQKAAQYQLAPEFVSPDAYLNTNNLPITLEQYRGKKVVLIDFWTYSCINCQRTLPYLATWYDKYEDQGLVIIGVHTPEFAFEQVEGNVQKALSQFGVKYPVILDNKYKTWDAFGNNVWPRKYLIDIDGYIVYDHAGEGSYDVTERAIQGALRERAARLRTGDIIASSTTSIQPADLSGIQSPETYFGSSRNEYLANGTRYSSGEQTFTMPPQTELNKLYLGGTWNVNPEFAQARAGNTVTYRYSSKDVFIVANSDAGAVIEILQDGKPIGGSAGKDVENGVVTIRGSRLYHIVSNSEGGEHTLTIKINGVVQFYTFTFG